MLQRSIGSNDWNSYVSLYFRQQLLYLHPARYESSSVADTFQTIGYLVPIIASLCVSILPRAQFVEMMLLNTACSTQTAPHHIIVKTDFFIGQHSSCICIQPPQCLLLSASPVALITSCRKCSREPGPCSRC